jgi:hypothetical protein
MIPGIVATHTLLPGCLREVPVHVRILLWVIKFNKKNRLLSALSGTLFEINNPAGNGPEHGYRLLGFVKFSALGKDPVIIR